MDLLSQVRILSAQHELLADGDSLVVGVSGGPDSLCLLHLLLRLQDEYRLRLHIAHLDHGARGAESQADAEWVAELAARWGLAATVHRVDVPAVARAHKLAFEEAARRVRYEFLARVAAAVGANKVAVGHNADDQAETVLMHWLRGAGPAGLRGMLPATPLSSYRLLAQVTDTPLPTPVPLLIRPLLNTPRAAIERYVAEHDLQPRIDRSNLDTTFFRNRLRHELLPLLEGYHPNVRRRLLHTAQIVAADYELLEQLRDQAWQATVRFQDETRVVLDRAAWDALHLSLQRALLREAAYRLRPALRDVSFVHVDAAVRLAHAGQAHARAALPGGLALTVGYDELTIADTTVQPLLDGPTLPRGQQLPIALPGHTALPGSPWHLETTVLHTWNQQDVENNPDRWTACLDGAALPAALSLRTRRSGDRFRPQGMGGHAPRLTDWMISARVPRPWREQLPLLANDDEILWVCGWRIAERAAVGPQTQQVVRFRFQNDEPRTKNDF